MAVTVQDLELLLLLLVITYLLMISNQLIIVLFLILFLGSMIEFISFRYIIERYGNGSRSWAWVLIQFTASHWCEQLQVVQNDKKYPNFLTKRVQICQDCQDQDWIVRMTGDCMSNSDSIHHSQSPAVNIVWEPEKMMTMITSWNICVSLSLHLFIVKLGVQV